MPCIKKGDVFYLIPTSLWDGEGQVINTKKAQPFFRPLHQIKESICFRSKLIRQVERILRKDGGWF